MKVIKKFGSDTESRALMEVFDRVLASTYYKWTLDSLEVYVSEYGRGDSWIEGNSGKIFFGREDQFVRSMDRKGMEAVVLCRLHSLIMKMQGIDVRDARESYYSNDRGMFSALLMAEEFAENRRVAKQFPDRIFYKRFSEISSASPSTTEDFLRLGMCWLTFHGIDSWNAEYLEKTAMQKMPRDFDFSVFETMKPTIPQGPLMGRDEILAIAGIMGKFISGAKPVQ